MNEKTAKQLRRKVRQHKMDVFKGAWCDICDLPLKMRAVMAWRLLLGKKGGCA